MFRSTHVPSSDSQAASMDTGITTDEEQARHAVQERHLNAATSTDVEDPAAELNTQAGLSQVAFYVFKNLQSLMCLSCLRLWHTVT